MRVVALRSTAMGGKAVMCSRELCDTAPVSKTALRDGRRRVLVLSVLLAFGREFPSRLTRLRSAPVRPGADRPARSASSALRSRCQNCHRQCAGPPDGSVRLSGTDRPSGAASRGRNDPSRDAGNQAAQPGSSCCKIQRRVRVGRGRPPFQAEKLAQSRPMHVDERIDGAIRVRPGDRRQDSKQNDMEQRIELALGATKVFDLPNQQVLLLAGEY
jgi:hypothetical protein